MELITYSDIINSVREKLGIQSSDTLATNKIKRIINEIYLDEVVPFKATGWFWLRKTIQVIHKAAYTTGTASVVNDSTSVTLSTAPSVGLGSFLGYRFSIDNSSQVYIVAAHTAGSTSITLSTAYQEDTDSDATFKIWRDRINLPTNAKETIDIWHNHLPQSLDPIGPQEFREREAFDAKAESFPCEYCTSDYYDPTSGTDEMESDRFRQTQIYPSITNQNVILNVDYTQEATALEEDIDEPLMPLGDRIVLMYGALAVGYSVLARNEEMHDRYRLLFQNKLSRMAGNRDEGQDTPKLSPKSSYVNNIRRSGLRRYR